MRGLDVRARANSYMAEGLIRSVHSFDLEALAHQLRQG